MGWLLRLLCCIGGAWLSMAGSLGGQDLQLTAGATGGYLQLKALQSTGRVLQVVAHPDDEDGAALAYCARGLGADTMLFSITRGEGGANLISSHFFDELGALRTLEHVKAADYYGNRLFYSRAADYGFSKTLEEALDQWENAIPVLADLVEVIRRERPLVLLSRFQGDARDGHGHHQTAGFISRLAFEVSAKVDWFPEQIQRGLQPWQAKKLYFRAGSRWRQPDQGEWTVALPTGTYDPVIGRSYAEVARFGLGFQRSQGMSGHDGEPGMRYSYYALAKHHGAAELPERESSIFDGIDTTLTGLVQGMDQVEPEVVSALEGIEQGLKHAYEHWQPLNREPTVSALLGCLTQLRSILAERDSLPASLEHELDGFAARLQATVATVAGIRLDAWATDVHGNDINHATPLEPIQVHVRLANQSNSLPVTMSSLDISMPGGGAALREVADQHIAAGDVVKTEVEVDTANWPPTKPHWRRATIASPLYEVDVDGQQRPLPDPPVVVTALVSVADCDIEIASGVRIRQRHPTYGRVTFPLTVAPPMNVRFPLQNGLVPKGTSKYSIPVRVQSCLGKPTQATARLILPTGWRCDPPEIPLSFQREDQIATVDFSVTIPANVDAKAHEIRARVDLLGQAYSAGFETVSARQVGRMNVYREAIHRVQVADVKMAGQPTVGYIMGSGDQVAESLVALNVRPTMLAESDLASSDLSQFDVILVGVRAYAVREDVRRHNGRLLDYVKNGGVLIVQYQTPEFDQNFGPYPYEMGSRPEEVSEEDAAVTILQPQHPLLTTPNQITSADFHGWFEQRGSKFWKSWDEHYTPLFECHDRVQAPQRGGMLVAQFGKGVYIYSAYAWYRQLPQGVPGAYRLFANMLSLPKSDLMR